MEKQFDYSALDQALGDPEAALGRWADALGAENVLSDDDILARYARTTLTEGTRPLAVIRPASTAEVAEAVRIAGEFRIPLYPISRGRNWGYGDACAVTDGQVIMDLGRMNRILEVDETLAYAVVEPGVTQGQLSDHLQDNGLALWMDCTGAGPETSLVGNVMERGFGHSVNGDRFRQICGLEVVLADGRVLKTGFGHYENARATRVYPYGVGPVLDGIFTQSNFGIVTRIGLWLMPKPAVSQVFICSLEAEDGIGALIDDLRPLRLDGTLRGIVHIGNDLRAISGDRGFPGQQTGDSPPLSDGQRRALRRDLGVGAWTAWGGLTGTPDQVSTARRAIRRRLKGPGRKLVFLDRRKVALGRRLTRWLGALPQARALGRKLNAVEGALDLVQGRPNARFLSGAYWRKPGGPPDPAAGSAERPVDPRDDACGLLWLSPVMPMTGAAADDLLALVRPIFAAYRFDFFVTLSLVNERALSAVINIAFDQGDADERTWAEACYKALFESLRAGGFPPYRVGIQSMAELAEGSEVFWDVAGALKGALDPDGIIAPGRYDPHGAPQRATND